jgi:thiol-disulfide isomerase/thioredoxin
MHKFLLIIGLITHISVGGFAQTLRFDLPYYKGKEAVVVMKQGVRNDTLQRFTFDGFGKVTVATAKLEHPALAALLIGTEVQFPFIASPSENALISGKNEPLTPQNTVILNSVENAEIARWGKESNLLKAKSVGINQLLAFYTEGSPFSKNLNKEKNDLAKSMVLLSDTLKKSPLFAAKYIQLRELLENTIKHTAESPLAIEASHNALLNEVDMTALHGSDIWFEVLNNCLDIYPEGSAHHKKFGEDMVVLMKKTNLNAVVTDLAEAAISICAQFSWDKDQSAIVDYLIAANRISNPKGGLKKLMQMQAIAVGKKAPDLIFIQYIGRVEDHNHQTTQLKSEAFSESQALLIFYQSGCGPCETTMNALRDNYEDLTKKGVKIIAISADKDELVFKNTANSYPWKDSYCDLEGTQGINFKNYAVLGTPTMILVDKKGNIAAKITSVEELLQHIKQDIKF